MVGRSQGRRGPEELPPPRERFLAARRYDQKKSFMGSSKRLVLHVGMHKTGSTSIQNSFATFESPSVSYLQLSEGGANHSYAYNTLFRSNPLSYYVHAQMKRSTNQIQKLQDKLRLDIKNFMSRTSADTILSSGEDLTHLTSAELSNLKSFYLSYVSEIHILGYVRPPISFMTSALQQRVRGITSKPLTPGELYPNYRNTFERFFSVFGDRHVSLRPFVPKLLFNGDVVQDFARFNGVVLEHSSIVNANVSMGVEPLALLYNLISDVDLNKALTSTSKARSLLRSTLERFGKTKFSMSLDLVKPVLESKRSDLEWISEKLHMNIVDSPGESNFQLQNMDELYTIAKWHYSKIIDYVSKESATLNPSAKTVALATALLESIQADIHS